MLSRKRGATSMLTEPKEHQLVQYVIAMQNLGFPLTIYQLKLKVTIFTHGRDTPFTNGIPSLSWLRWFRRRHPELSLRLAQGFDAKKQEAYQLIMSIVSMKMYLYCMVFMSTHLLVYGNVMKLECRLGAMEELMFWPKQGLKMCTKLSQINESG